MRVVEAERLRQMIETERALNADISKGEIKQRVREIRIYRRLARLSSNASPSRPQAGATKAKTRDGDDRASGHRQA